MTTPTSRTVPPITATTARTAAAEAARAVRRGHGPLAWFAVGMAALSLVTVVAWALDDRVLVGAPIWAKPLKFSLSFTLYASTLAWLLGHTAGRGRRVGWWAGTVIVVASVVEMAAIVGQVVRGRQSHFNTTTGVDAAVFSVMGATIAVLWTATLVIAVLLLRTRLPDAALTWAVRAGVVVGLLGLSLGALMLVPTPAQSTALAAGTTSLVGAHSVGVPDGGPGLPLLGWSTTGGDLRVGHFVGMHALQLLPLLAAALGLAARAGLFGGRLTERTRVRLVLLAAAAYTAVVAVVTLQALRAQPLVSADGPTLAALGVVLVLSVATAAAVVARAGGMPAPARSVADPAH